MIGAPQKLEPEELECRFNIFNWLLEGLFDIRLDLKGHLPVLLTGTYRSKVSPTNAQHVQYRRRRILLFQKSQRKEKTVILLDLVEIECPNNK
jgi:hypothetical protein